mmetsp:Transcript_11490/g.13703  ORF Transcript_11490/g.13703 Transcript_11490/m.13703 type:complete len:87 (+) Transcript_11490:110-370(+)
MVSNWLHDCMDLQGDHYKPAVASCGGLQRVPREVVDFPRQSSKPLPSFHQPLPLLLLLKILLGKSMGEERIDQMECTCCPNFQLSR